MESGTGYGKADPVKGLDVSVADAGLLMPPKSTWFEPKLRSGIFIHRLQPEVWASRQDIWRSKLDCNRGATGVTET